MNKLDLLKLAELEDEEAFEEYDFREDCKTETREFKADYEEFYDDVKQPNKYIKEDW